MRWLPNILAIFLLAPFTSLFGQASSPSQSPSPQLQQRPAAQPATPPGGSDRDILLDVQATDKSGKQVRGLQKQDFTLLDDNQPREIVSFAAVEGSASPNQDPVEIILVVDAVNVSFQTVTYEGQEIKKFLLRNGGKLENPVSLVTFSDNGTKVQDDASRDGNALAALYDQYVPALRTITRSQGIYGAAERFDLSLKAIGQVSSYERKRPGRKLMIWMSPGWPMLSGPAVQLTSAERQQIFNSIVTVSAALRQARITLYSVDPLGQADAGGARITYYEQFVKGEKSSAKVLPGDLGLQVLVVQSGGRVINGTNDLADAIGKCASDAEAFYTLSFHADAAEQPDEYHTLKVTVDRSGVTARTRTGYYAQP